MNRHFTWVATIFLLTLSMYAAEGPDDQYVQIYNLIQEADGLNDSGQQRPAMTRYLDAQRALQQFLAAHPSWNEKLVKFRLDYVATKLEPLALKLPATNSSPRISAAVTNLLDPASANQLRLWQDEISRLTAQNTLLEAKLKEAWSVQPATTDSAESKRVAEAIRQIEKERDLLKVALQQEQSKSVAAPDSTFSKPEKQLALAKAANKQLEQENDELKRKLNAANRELARRGGPVTSPPLETTDRQLETLKARLQVYEAKPIPYSTEELAMLNRPVMPATAATVPAPARKRSKEPPPGAGALMSQAMRSIDTGLLPDAERKLQEVLRQDERNVYVLAVLAGVQMGMKRFDDAERNLKQALTVDPEDPESLYLMGFLRYEQKRLDDALDALSLSARIEPERADTQLYLGKVLLQKGNLNPAEAALRKAVQIAPRAAEAHFHLAETYTLQQPPSLQLAQWHYNKALTGGVPRSEEFEKLMESKKSPGPAR